MKKIVSALLIAVIILSLASCAIFPKYLLKIKANEITKMNIVRVSDELEASYDADSKSIVKILNEINAVLFFENGKCKSDEDQHAFIITLETEDKTYEVFINQDGSICLDGNHYVVDFSSKNTINMSILERMVNEANVKEEEVIEEIIEEEPETIIETEEIDPQEFADSVIKVISYTDIAKVNGVRYFIANADVLNQNSNILAGETDEGRITLFYKTDSTSTINYIEGSYEQSGGKKLYFSTTTVDGYISCSYLDIESNKCLNLSSGNTSNLALFETPVSTIMGHGWIVADDSIVAINLETGQINNEMTISIKEDAKAKVINNHFFEKYLEGYDKKTVALSTLDSEQLIITVTESSSEGLPDIVTEFTYNCSDKSFKQN